MSQNIRSDLTGHTGVDVGGRANRSGLASADLRIRHNTSEKKKKKHANKMRLKTIHLVI